MDMIFQFIRLSQCDQDSDRYEASLLAIEPGARPHSAKDELHRERRHSIAIASASSS
jgi:hypothetical protein